MSGHPMVWERRPPWMSFKKALNQWCIPKVGIDLSAEESSAEPEVVKSKLQQRPSLKKPPIRRAVTEDHKLRISSSCSSSNSRRPSTQRRSSVQCATLHRRSSSANQRVEFTAKRLSEIVSVELEGVDLSSSFDSQAEDDDRNDVLSNQSLDGSWLNDSTEQTTSESSLEGEEIEEQIQNEMGIAKDDKWMQVWVEGCPSLTSETPASEEKQVLPPQETSVVVLELNASLLVSDIDRQQPDQLMSILQCPRTRDLTIRGSGDEILARIPAPVEICSDGKQLNLHGAPSSSGLKVSLQPPVESIDMLLHWRFCLDLACRR